MTGRSIENADRWVNGRKYLIDGDRMRIMQSLEMSGCFVIIVYHHKEGRFSQHIDIFEDQGMAREMLSLHREQQYLEDAVWSDQTSRWEYLRPELDTPAHESLRAFFRRLRQ